ncbi:MULTISPECIES: acyltransferase [unclassified Paenibacillus]|uniref:acyltransferase n=1 Tax=unclassified Paenibacillus TaxID=185978 RepID=UPI0010492284|nr:MULTISPECIES: acyltransferase [unclassified Paenibacillus]NIK70468.1 serine/alanine racemase [Paenibacillus sp. BK720]TCM90965.1 surface polysaccharide O-acyltransferase-like enzyme [Paenibacillus sp. BK033]
MSRTGYGGLDWLKFAAALLVVANHTSPLLSYSASADFLVSNLLTRIAVPVFFMTAGFLLFRKLTGNPLTDRKAVQGYLLKILKLYAIAIVLYIPLNLYTGYFSDSFTAYSVIKDIVFDGTFYHLWYLPALMIGLLITCTMVRFLPMNAVLASAGLLYIVGLLGDSYYGILQNHAGLAHLYEGMFTVFDYTRNGLFYAPIYLAMGAWAAKQPPHASKPIVNAALFAGSLGLMFVEGMLLRSSGMPRHDSMYVFALPATYFLFQWSMQWKVPASKRFREWRTWVYILHPLAIVLVRGAAKAAHLERLFVVNSLLHFAAVCLLSIAMSAFSAWLSAIIRKFKDPMRMWITAPVDKWITLRK